jgi:hypothetical protein
LPIFFAKILAFFAQTAAIFCKNLAITLFFEKKRQFVCKKLVKSDLNIGYWSSSEAGNFL